MLRTSIISALFVTALATASTASADDCMCLNLNENGPWPQLLLERQGSIGLESFEVGPFFSSDGTLLWSAQQGFAHRKDEPGGFLWCASPYDPRCAPATPSPESPQVSISSGTSAASFSRRHDWPSLRTLPMAMNAQGDGLSPAAGVRARIERPPQR